MLNIGEKNWVLLFLNIVEYWLKVKVSGRVKMFREIYLIFENYIRQTCTVGVCSCHTVKIFCENEWNIYFYWFYNKRIPSSIYITSLNMFYRLVKDLNASFSLNCLQWKTGGVIQFISLHNYIMTDFDLLRGYKQCISCIFIKHLFAFDLIRRYKYIHTNVIICPN